MAVYRFEAKVIGRSSGRSATGAAAYRAAERILDERTGLVHDYTRKGGVLHGEIMDPRGTIRDRAGLWNAVEQGEKRKDAQLCREILLNLPHELTPEQRRELVREFVREQFVNRGMVADIAIHAPHRKGDDRNAHAHVMLTMRERTADGFGQKVRDWNSPEVLAQWREQWANHQNRALERAGRTERVDHRSLEAQGIDREPEPKQGPVATKMERQGRPSKAGDDRRAVKARNAERDEIKAEAKIIDLQLERLKRQEQQQQQRRQADHGRQREIDRQQARFETWANARRADLQNRRLEAAGELGRAHQRERQAEEQGLDKFYKPYLDPLKAEAAAIGKRQQSGGLRGLVYRMSGRADRDRERADEIKASIADLEQRKAERMQTLEQRQAGEIRQLAARHAEQERQLERRIEQRRAEREAEGWRPLETGREATTGREIDAQRDEGAEKTPVQGRESSTGKTTPEQSQATHGPPERTQKGIHRDYDRHRFGYDAGRGGHDEGRSRSR